MDFTTMKRKELQSLCKKHGIPANLSNAEMVKRISSVLEVKEKTKSKSCIRSVNNEVDNVDEENKKLGKRVKFSPDNETFEFERTDPRACRLLARKRRASIKPQIEADPSLVSDNEKNPVGNSRSSKRKTIVNFQVEGNNSTDVGCMEKPVGRNLRRKSMVVSVSEEVSNVDIVVEKENKGKNVEVSEGLVSEDVSEDKKPIVGKNVGRNLRRKSMGVSVSQDVTNVKIDKGHLVSEDVGEIEKPIEGKNVGRNLRRKSMGVSVSQDVMNVKIDKGHLVSEDVGEIEKPIVGKNVGRNLRRKSMGVSVSQDVINVKVDKGNSVSEDVGKVEKSIEGGNVVRNLRSRGKKTMKSEEDTTLDVKDNKISVIDETKNDAATIKRRLRSREAQVDCFSEKSENVMNVTRRSTRQTNNHDVVKNQPQGSVEVPLKDGKRKRNVKKTSYEKLQEVKEVNDGGVEEECGVNEVRVVKRSTRRTKELTKVDASLSESVLGEIVPQSKEEHIDKGEKDIVEVVTHDDKSNVDETDHKSAEEPTSGAANIDDSVSENKKSEVEVQIHEVGSAISVEQKEEKCEIDVTESKDSVEKTPEYEETNAVSSVISKEDCESIVPVINTEMLEGMAESDCGSVVKPTTPCSSTAVNINVSVTTEEEGVGNQSVSLKQNLEMRSSSKNHDESNIVDSQTTDSCEVDEQCNTDKEKSEPADIIEPNTDKEKSEPEDITEPNCIIAKNSTSPRSNKVDDTECGSDNMKLVDQSGEDMDAGVKDTNEVLTLDGKPNVCVTENVDDALTNYTSVEERTLGVATLDDGVSENMKSEVEEQCNKVDDTDRGSDDMKNAEETVIVDRSKDRIVQETVTFTNDSNVQILDHYMKAEIGLDAGVEESIGAFSGSSSINISSLFRNSPIDDRVSCVDVSTPMCTGTEKVHTLESNKVIDDDVAKSCERSNDQLSKLPLGVEGSIAESGFCAESKMQDGTCIIEKSGDEILKVVDQGKEPELKDDWVEEQGKEVEPNDDEVVDHGIEIEPIDDEVVDHGKELEPKDDEVVDHGKEPEPIDDEVVDHGKEPELKDDEVVDHGKEAEPIHDEVVDHGKEPEPIDDEVVDHGKEAEPKDDEVVDHGKEAEPIDDEVVDHGKEPEPIDDEVVNHGKEPEPIDDEMSDQGTEAEPKEGQVEDQGTEAEPKEGQIEDQGTEPEVKDGQVEDQGTEAEPKEGQMEDQGTEPEVKDGQVEDQGTESEPTVDQVVHQEPEPKHDQVVNQGKELELKDDQLVDQEPVPEDDQMVEPGKEPEPKDGQMVEPGKEPGSEDGQMVEPGKEPEPEDDQVVEQEPESKDDQVVDQEPEPKDDQVVGQEAEPKLDQVVDQEKEHEPNDDQVVDQEKEPEPKDDQVVDHEKEPEPKDGQVVDQGKEPEPKDDQMVDQVTEPEPNDYHVFDQGEEPEQKDDQMVDQVTEPEPNDDHVVDQGEEPEQKDDQVAGQGTEPEPKDDRVVEQEPEPEHEHVVDQEPEPNNDQVVDQGKEPEPKDAQEVDQGTEPEPKDDQEVDQGSEPEPKDGQVEDQEKELEPNESYDCTFREAEHTTLEAFNGDESTETGAETPIVMDRYSLLSEVSLSKSVEMTVETDSVTLHQNREREIDFRSINEESHYMSESQATDNTVDMMDSFADINAGLLLSHSPVDDELIAPQDSPKKGEERVEEMRDFSCFDNITKKGEENEGEIMVHDGSLAIQHPEYGQNFMDTKLHDIDNVNVLDDVVIDDDYNTISAQSREGEPLEGSFMVDRNVFGDMPDTMLKDDHLTEANDNTIETWQNTSEDEGSDTPQRACLGDDDKEMCWDTSLFKEDNQDCEGDVKTIENANSPLLESAIVAEAKQDTSTCDISLSKCPISIDYQGIQDCCGAQLFEGKVKETYKCEAPLLNAQDTISHVEHALKMEGEVSGSENAWKIVELSGVMDVDGEKLFAGDEGENIVDEPNMNDVENQYEMYAEREGDSGYEHVSSETRGDGRDSLTGTDGMDTTLEQVHDGLGGISEPEQNPDHDNSTESCMFSKWELDFIYGEMEKEMNEFKEGSSSKTTSKNETDTINANPQEPMETCTDNVGHIHESEVVNPSSMMKRNANRSILIHATPKKPVLFTHDMKENAPSAKGVKMVDVTAVRPIVKRKALGDLGK